ncbi:REP-associated tyrosine transposase [Sporomusa sphaeroides]|uniref:Transposase IS200 like protein n=1 Tax=Sporomusa sphaeroides DSM 2875 TaxID=1337886 RepID=A0ABP2CF98_9FIRM|nr:transposase [Sporomusa sphaeroides]OLS54894.1 transposase IS200 like protein [Sporomusa sphaeroides DSM 2875]CVK21085.1 Transposase IS200 like protein [Sporomusa sphaeroides DSM 2875]
MARCAREKSVSGIYHIMMRGINRQDIFLDEDDRCRFLEIIKRVQESGSCSIYGYCLMNNHIHLLLQEKEEELSIIMKRIGTSYAWRYNKKYDRVGHVFQNRFQSEPVDTEAYLLGVLRYIHNNPVKAKLVAKPEDYQWSSCQAYYQGQDSSGLVNTPFVLSILNGNGEAAIKQFADFMHQENADQFMDFKVKQRKSDDDLAQAIKEQLNGQPIELLQNMDIAMRNKIIREIKELEGVTQRQIARVTGIHQSIIFKA